MALADFGGVWAPFTIAIPSFPFNCFLSGGLHELMNKMFRTAAVIAALFVHLGIFYCSSQPVLQSLLINQGHHFLDPHHCWHLLSSNWARHMAGFFVNGWLPFNFLKGKKEVALSLEGPSVAGALGLQDNSIVSFSASLAALR